MSERNTTSPRIDRAISPIVTKAIEIATYAHEGQMRKCGNIPFIEHPLAVMDIASAVTSDEKTLAACALHDVFEDALDKYDRITMARDFGKEVVEIVNGVTKDKANPSWHQRAHDYLAHLQVAPSQSLIVCAADKIHNLQSFLADYETHGEELWSRFNAGKNDQLWWYSSVLDILESRIPDSPLTHQLAELVDRATAEFADN